MRNGLVAPWRTPAYREMNDWMLKLARRRKIRTSAPFREMTDEERTWLLDGDEGPRAKWDEDKWPGVHGFFKWLEGRRYKTHVRILLAKYRRFVTCPACGGAKLKAEALNVLVDGRSIADVGRLSIRDLVTWLDKIESIAEVATRAAVVMRELRNRVGYLVEVGLGYLTVERQARTLSGGEAQRIHLASALGSVLVGTLYALDEPTVGLHAADARRLLAVLYSLRDFGNTVVVVEHDPAMIAGADHVVELGPGGGSEGGELTYLGTAGEGDTRQHGVVAGTRAADARAGEAAQVHQARSRDSNHRRARAQSRRHRRRDSGWPHGLRDRSFRIGKIDAGRGRALQQLSAPIGQYVGGARRVRSDRRPRADRRDGAYGAGVADALDALESGDLPENLRRYPQAVRRQSRSAPARACRRGIFRSTSRAGDARNAAAPAPSRSRCISWRTSR